VRRSRNHRARLGSRAVQGRHLGTAANFGFVVTGGHAEDVIAKLHDEIVAIGNDPAFRQKRLIDIGIVPVFDTTEHFAAYLKVQRDNGRKLIRESGYQPR